jgi:hypothetical protein
MKSFLTSFSLGRPWLINQLVWNEATQDMIAQFNTIKQYLQWPSTSFGDLYQSLLNRKKKYALWQLLDALLYQQGDTSQETIDALILAKKRLQTNVSVDTILFELSLHCSM